MLNREKLNPIFYPFVLAIVRPRTNRRPFVESDIESRTNSLKRFENGRIPNGVISCPREHARASRHGMKRNSTELKRFRFPRDSSPRYEAATPSKASIPIPWAKRESIDVDKEPVRWKFAPLATKNSRIHGNQSPYVFLTSVPRFSSNGRTRLRQREEDVDRHGKRERKRERKGGKNKKGTIKSHFPLTNFLLSYSFRESGIDGIPGVQREESLERRQRSKHFSAFGFLIANHRKKIDHHPPATTIRAEILHSPRDSLFLFTSFRSTPLVSSSTLSFDAFLCFARSPLTPFLPSGIKLIPRNHRFT